MRTSLLHYLLLAGGLASCTKDPTTGTTTLTGQVVESQTRKPVAGTTVQVQHASSGGGYVPVAITRQW